MAAPRTHCADHRDPCGRAATCTRTSSGPASLPVLTRGGRRCPRRVTGEVDHGTWECGVDVLSGPGRVSSPNVPLGHRHLPPCRPSSPRVRARGTGPWWPTAWTGDPRFGIVLIARDPRWVAAMSDCPSATRVASRTWPQLPDGRSLMFGAGRGPIRVTEWLPTIPTRGRWWRSGTRRRVGDAQSLLRAVHTVRAAPAGYWPSRGSRPPRSRPDVPFDDDPVVGVLATLRSRRTSTVYDAHQLLRRERADERLALLQELTEAAGTGPAPPVVAELRGMHAGTRGPEGPQHPLHHDRPTALDASAATAARSPAPR